MNKNPEQDAPREKKRSRAPLLVLLTLIALLGLAALIYLTMKGASVMPLLVTGAVLLVVLRLMKRLLPRVSAS